VTHIQKEYVQVTSQYPASYRQHKKIRNLFLTLAVKVMCNYCGRAFRCDCSPLPSYFVRVIKP